MRKFPVAIAAVVSAVLLSTAALAGSSARTPKHLENAITINMGDLFFGANGNDVFTVPAGKTVGIRIVNTGMVEHEIMFGRGLRTDGEHGYTEELLENIPVDVFVFPDGRKIEVESLAGLEEIELEPGAELWLRVEFPESAVGTWEIGCFVPGHYEAGMHTEFVVE